MNRTEHKKAAAKMLPILFVEDSADDYEATIRAFVKADMRNPVNWCRSGREALDFLRREGNYKNPEKSPRPGLIILDLNMPGLDGRKTLQIIKEDAGLSNIPVIILSTSDNENDINYCNSLGADMYIQ